jgi:hypothetical protein
MALAPLVSQETNPIPVNGPIGELAYLSKLETVQGERILFHRIGTVNMIDVLEAVTFSGSEWFILFIFYSLIFTTPGDLARRRTDFALRRTWDSSRGSISSARISLMTSSR